MAFLLAAILLPEHINCLDLFGFPLPNNLGEVLTDIVKPIEEYLEPYKKVDIHHERGVPELHEEYSKLFSFHLIRKIFILIYYLALDCTQTPEDPQCSHEHFRESPMVGAGHHVRAKTNSPIIGILMQPIPQNEIWESEFERI